MDKIFKMKALYEGEGEGEIVPPETAPPGKTFTQDELNTILANEKRTMQEKISAASTELKAIQQKFNLTAAEKEQLAQQVERLNNTFKSQQQIEKEKRDKEAQENAKKLEELTESNKTWKDKYEGILITKAITEAAVAHEAIDPNQIIELKKGSVSLINEIIDGKQTGEYNPVMKIRVLDDKGKLVDLELPVSEAIEKMSQSKQYANLFKSKGTGGTGMNNSAETPGPLTRESVKNMSMEEYMKVRPSIIKE
jgi:hypothetical protein